MVGDPDVDRADRDGRIVFDDVGGRCREVGVRPLGAPGQADLNVIGDRTDAVNAEGSSLCCQFGCVMLDRAGQRID